MQKKKYVKPELKKVKLLAEEAVLGNCKAATGATSKVGRCQSAGCANRVVGS